MKGSEVRILAQKFREETGFGRSVEDAFAPWYLQTEYHLPADQSMAQSSDGGYDYGIDAFCLCPPERPSGLVLVQSKLTNSLNSVSRGFRELEKCLPEISKALAGTGTDVSVENKVLVNLRSALNKIDPDERRKLSVEFQVLHLCEDDEAIIGLKTAVSKQSLKEGAERYLKGHLLAIRDVRPNQLGPQVIVVPPPQFTSLTLESVQLVAGTKGARMHYGVGRLAELVDLYSVRRDDLFSKNVRYFLFGKKKAERGPAGKMRETLKRICLAEGDSLDPAIFALYHNGVTLHARRVESTETGVRIAQPYVLNGCQTIKAAFYFRNDPNLKERIDNGAWRKVPVPIRLVETDDEELVRQITINNNRQNQIAPVAFRANDPVQIQLEERLRLEGIFYERQEGAYENLEKDRPEIIQEEYENTLGRAVQIEDLGRAIAAVAGDLGLAQRPSDLFESDSAYKRCFSSKRLQSVTFLIFLQNLHDVMGVVLKNDLGLRKDDGSFSPVRLKYHSINLFARYLARAGEETFVREYGGSLYGKDWTFRHSVGVLMTRSGIRRELREKLMGLDLFDAESIADGFRRAEGTLRLRGVDPFEAFGGLDGE